MLKTILFFLLAFFYYFSYAHSRLIMNRKIIYIFTVDSKRSKYINAKYLVFYLMNWRRENKNNNNYLRKTICCFYIYGFITSSNKLHKRENSKNFVF